MADNRDFSGLLSTASSLLNPKSHANPNPSHAAPASDSHAQKPHHDQKPSFGEVFSSANVVMDAAKSKLHKSGDSASHELDKEKISAAAGILVGAVSNYGELEQTSYGQYAHKAQEFLHDYGAKHGTSQARGEALDPPPHGGSDRKP